MWVNGALSACLLQRHPTFLRGRVTSALEDPNRYAAPRKGGRGSQPGDTGSDDGNFVIGVDEPALAERID